MIWFQEKNTGRHFLLGFISSSSSFPLFTLQFWSLLTSSFTTEDLLFKKQMRSYPVEFYCLLEGQMAIIRCFSHSYSIIQYQPDSQDLKHLSFSSTRHFPHNFWEGWIEPSILFWTIFSVQDFNALKANEILETSWFLGANFLCVSVCMHVVIQSQIFNV